MEDTLVINGITYIKKEQVEQMEKQLDNVRQLATQTIADLNALLGNQVVEQSTPQVVEQPAKKTYKDERKFKLRKVARQEYKIARVSPSGHLYSIHNRKFIFTIQDVLKVRKELSSHTTKGDVDRMAKNLDLQIDNVHRIIYNIQEHVFDPFIKEYLQSANDIEIKPKSTELQNNPQKRKEFGYS